jgi:hypothetical protein
VPRFSAVAAAIVFLSAAAGADTVVPAPPGETTPSSVAAKVERPQIAISTNAPFMWPHSVSGSLAIGFETHHAIRANVARYDNGGDLGVLIGDVFFDGDGSDAITKGRNLDVGVSYMVFPRRLWDGFFVEAGALIRDKYKDVTDEFASPSIVITDTTTFAVRGHIGWSWLVGNHFFMQAAIGASTGHETGRETTGSAFYSTQMETHDVSRSATSAEGFFRIGGAFDITR